MAFFRLNRLIHLGFIALKARILKERHAFRIPDFFLLRHLLVMSFTRVGLAQKRNSLFLDGGNHDILVTRTCYALSKDMCNGFDESL